MEQTGVWLRKSSQEFSQKWLEVMGTPVGCGPKLLLRDRQWVVLPGGVATGRPLLGA